MTEKHVHVVKVTRKDRHYVDCPICGTSHWLDKKRQMKRESVVEKEDATVTTKRVWETTICHGCGIRYIIDYGESTYTIYHPPLQINIAEKLITEFKSDWQYNFTIKSVSLPINGDFARMEEHYGLDSEYKNTSALLLQMDFELMYKNPDIIQKYVKAVNDHEVYPNLNIYLE